MNQKNFYMQIRMNNCMLIMLKLFIIVSILIASYSNVCPKNCQALWKMTKVAIKDAKQSIYSHVRWEKFLNLSQFRLQENKLSYIPFSDIIEFEKPNTTCPFDRMSYIYFSNLSFVTVTSPAIAENLSMEAAPQQLDLNEVTHPQRCKNNDFYQNWKDRLIKQQQNTHEGLLGGSMGEKNISQSYKEWIKSIGAEGLVESYSQIKNWLLQVKTKAIDIKDQWLKDNGYMSSKEEQKETQEKEQLEQKQRKLFKELNSRKNFASKDSGATILWKSDGLRNVKAILSGNKDEYLILPECKKDQEYSLIINLSEDVAVDTIVASNHEDFSDTLSEIEFFGSIEYPPEKWVELGEIRPKFGEHEHKLYVELDKTQMIRYLKVMMKGQAGNELYCTLTSIRIFGQGMHVVMRNSLLDLVYDQQQQNSTSILPQQLLQQQQQQESYSIQIIDQEETNMCLLREQMEAQLEKMTGAEAKLMRAFYSIYDPLQHEISMMRLDEIKASQLQNLKKLKEQKEQLMIESQLSGIDYALQQQKILEQAAASKNSSNNGTQQSKDNILALEQLMKKLVQKLNKVETTSNQLLSSFHTVENLATSSYLRMEEELTQQKQAYSNQNQKILVLDNLLFDLQKQMKQEKQELTVEIKQEFDSKLQQMQIYLLSGALLAGFIILIILIFIFMNFNQRDSNNSAFKRKESVDGKSDHSKFQMQFKNLYASKYQKKSKSLANSQEQLQEDELSTEDAQKEPNSRINGILQKLQSVHITEPLTQKNGKKNKKKKKPSQLLDSKTQFDENIELDSDHRYGTLINHGQTTRNKQTKPYNLMHKDKFEPKGIFKIINNFSSQHLERSSSHSNSDIRSPNNLLMRSYSSDSLDDDQNKFSMKEINQQNVRGEKVLLPKVGNVLKQSTFTMQHHSNKQKQLKKKAQ